MADFRLETPDGVVYQVTADTPEQAYAALQEMLAGMSDKKTQEQPSSAVQQYIEAGYKTISKYRDGQVMEDPSTQERVFVSPGYVTKDPQVIEGILQGVTPSETQRGQIQEQIIEEYPVAARAATALQGVPFVGSYIDELTGEIKGPEAAAGVRRAVEAVEQRRPLQAGALQVGGALASVPLLVEMTPAAVGRFVGAPTSVGGQMVRGAAVGAPAGAIEGAISGYGRGQGEGRIDEAATGGAIGGAVGGLVGGVFPGVSAAVEAGWRNIRGRSVPQIARTLGISNDAAKVVRTALENDDIAAATVALQRAGSNSMLADAGPSTQNLLDVSITSGGAAPRAARQAVTQRAEESGERMVRVLDDMLGPPTGVETARREIREGTSAQRSREYRRAYAQPINYSGRRGLFLESLIDRVPRSAINEANRLMEVEGRQSRQISMNIADDGTVSFERLPDVEQWDYIVRSLNDVAEKENATGRLGGQTALGRAYANLARQIRGTLRDEVPEYAVALNTAADAIRRSQAVELGSDILRGGTTREDVADRLRGASASERAAARSGFRSAIDDTMANVNAVASDPNIDIREFQKLANTLRSRAMRDKMELLLGRDDAARLYNELDENIVSLELRAAIARNSATQQRQAIAGAVEDITAPGALSTLLSGRPLDASKRIAQVVTGTTSEARALRQMGIYDEIASVLVGLRGRQAQEALRLVRRAMDGEALNQTQARVIARALTTPAAAAAYTATTEQLQ